MKKHILVIIVICAPMLIQAAGRSDAGLTLLEDASSRQAALGGAYSAMTNDVAALNSNPSSLSTLQTGQASALFQRGIDEDSFGQINLGVPTRNGGWGFAVGYFDSGEINVFDGTTERNVTGQTDLVLNLGLARSIQGVSLGVSGKFISSELAEVDTARAVAADFGASFSIHQRIRLGIAYQNLGSELKFNSEGDELPEIARAGASVSMNVGTFPFLLLMDSPYHVNQKEFRPAAGIESRLGPLAMRVGYRHGNDLEEFSLGTGFSFGPASLDYAFGLVDELDSRHQFSVAMKFGSAPAGPDFNQNKQEIFYETPDTEIFIVPEVLENE